MANALAVLYWNERLAARQMEVQFFHSDKTGYKSFQHQLQNNYLFGATHCQLSKNFLDKYTNCEFSH